MCTVWLFYHPLFDPFRNVARSIMLLTWSSCNVSCLFASHSNWCRTLLWENVHCPNQIAKPNPKTLAVSFNARASQNDFGLSGIAHPSLHLTFSSASLSQPLSHGLVPFSPMNIHPHTSFLFTFQPHRWMCYFSTFKFVHISLFVFHPT